MKEQFIIPMISAIGGAFSGVLGTLYTQRQATKQKASTDSATVVVAQINEEGSHRKDLMADEVAFRKDLLARVEALENRVQHLESVNQDLRTENSRLRGENERIGPLEARVAHLESTIQQLQDDNLQLRTENERLKAGIIR